MPRTKHVIKNISAGYIANVANILIRFVSRTVFIYTLGVEFLGISGLFSNILGILSFAELGIGAAINYYLYKPVADNDIEKIKSYMLFYKKAYQVVGIVVAIVGLSIFPFLKYIVKDPGKLGNINIYYLIFLFNSVYGYWIIYKYSLPLAEQKGIFKHL